MNRGGIMRFHMLAVFGLALALPVTAAAEEHTCAGCAAAPAQEHTCACCAKGGHGDHTAATPSGADAAPQAGVTAPAYDVATEGIVAGVIHSIMRHAGMDVQLTIGVGEKSFDVLVAPINWLDSKQVVFRSGERVEILGARSEHGSGDTIVAREIHTADQTIVLRDDLGRPLWN
jgi:hypothetical protein